jgi:hypothetical protein
LEDAQTRLRQRVLEWTREWKEAGLQECLQEGRREGESYLLLQLLEHKFGDLDAVTRSRLETADDEELVHWGRRVLTAQRLEDVFSS